jgi:hypothetical protein
MILVTGATGNIGQELVPLLLETGQPIRVLVRDERKVAHLDKCVERAVGDFDKPETLLDAVKGIERLFLVTYETRQDVNVLKAAKEAGVRQIVKLSTLEAAEHKIKVGKWHYEREDDLCLRIEWTFLPQDVHETASNGGQIRSRDRGVSSSRAERRAGSRRSTRAMSPESRQLL